MDYVLQKGNKKCLKSSSAFCFRKRTRSLSIYFVIFVIFSGLLSQNRTRSILMLYFVVGFYFVVILMLNMTY